MNDFIPRETYSRGKKNPYGYIITHEGNPLIVAHATFLTQYESQLKMQEDMARLTIQNIEKKLQPRIIKVL